MAPAYTLTAETYALPILHAAQHPSSTVLGLLLAPSSSSSSPSSPAVEVTRAIPILHIDTSSSIYAEVAIDHVAVNAQREGLSVVGMYEAGTQPGEGEAGLSRAARGLSKGLKEKGEVFALAIDNGRLGKGENPYVLYTSVDPSRSLPTSSLVLPSPDLPKRTIALIRNRAKSGPVKVYDFDSHMEDPQADWLSNKAATQLIKDL